VEDAVDPEPDTQIGLGRLDVDVGRPVGHRLGDEEVHELDDGGVLDGLPGDVSFVVLGQLVGGDLGHLVDLGVEAVEAVDGLRQLGAGGHDHLDVGAGDGPQVVDGQDVARIGHGHDEPVLGPGDGEGEEAAGHGLGQEGDRAPVDGVLGQVDELEPQLAARAPMRTASVTAPSSTRSWPIGSPRSAWAFRAASSWAWVIRPSDSSISPSGWRKSRAGLRLPKGNVPP